MAEAPEASVLQAETVGSSAAIATDAALLAVGVAEDAPLLYVPNLLETPKVNVDGNTKPSVQQKKKKGTCSQHKHNDYLME
jgi:hypothetical protein